MNVRTAARNRRAARMRYAASARYAALSRESGFPTDVLRTFAGISEPRWAHQFSRDALAAHLRGRRHAAISFGAWAAAHATRITFPPAPSAVDW